MGKKPLLFSLEGQEPVALDRVSGTLGHDGFDLRSLTSSGLCSFDPGFSHTAGCQSAISYIDTEKSILLHRGYPVEHRALAATRLLSKMPTLAAMSYKFSIEQPAQYPRNDLSYAGNFLHMLFAIPAEKYTLNPVIEEAMNQILVLHADHGQCASTTTVRAAGSSGANLFACVAAGLASLWGPMHGGANEASMRMLEEIETVDQVSAFLRQAKRDPQAFRRLGFGNSRYQNLDPRAAILRDTCHRVLKEQGMSDSLLQVAMALEEVALTDPWFVENGLSPSVDFYTAVILKAMGLPSSMFVVVAAVGRTLGWVAHWNEMHQSPLTIYRPRQMYTGEKTRDYVSRRTGK